MVEMDGAGAKGGARQGGSGGGQAAAGTAKILAEAGRDMIILWDARNEEQQRWELALGIAQRKDEVMKREWKQAPSGTARGQPKKAPEELCAKYRMHLEGEERVKRGGWRG